MVNVLLLSTYELGHQPLNVARPAAHLLAAGHRVRCQDLAVEHLDEELVRWADLVGISAPMHTATRLGARLAEQVRSLNRECHVAFYGLYASLHADVLLGHLAHSAIGGEFETPLVELAGLLSASPRPRFSPAVAGVIGLDADGGTFLGRQEFLLPRRDLLPPLARYARVDTGWERKLVGYVEASRGCAHRCLHCPITPVYGGRLRIVPREVVLEDVRQLVALGAEHITFGDPDFFNGIRHSLSIVEALHDEFPWLTFDATIKIEHVLEHRRHLPTLVASGCLFVVSAVEAVQDDVLGYLRKGHTAADVEAALAAAFEVGLTVRPTFVPFTPWTSLDDYLELLDFIESHGLVRHVDSVQLAIRLLVPRGSSLLDSPALQPFLGPFEAESLSYRWRHSDPRLDGLHAAVSAVAEQAARDQQDAEETFAKIRELACAAAGRAVPSARLGARAPLDPVPRLTEPWFC